jgi:hypothetical protein
MGPPDASSKLQWIVQDWGNGTKSLFELDIRIQGSGEPWMRSLYSAPIPSPSTWDLETTVTVSIAIPARERKEVRIPAGSGTYDWLPPDVELEYALHPNPGQYIVVNVTSADTGLNDQQTFLADFLGLTTSLAPNMTPSVSLDGGVARNFTGTIAEVNSATCSLANR